MFAAGMSLGKLRNGCRQDPSALCQHLRSLPASPLRGEESVGAGTTFQGVSAPAVGRGPYPQLQTSPCLPGGISTPPPPSRGRGQARTAPGEREGKATSPHQGRLAWHLPGDRGRKHSPGTEGAILFLSTQGALSILGGGGAGGLAGEGAVSIKAGVRKQNIAVRERHITTAPNPTSFHCFPRGRGEREKHQ